MGFSKLPIFQFADNSLMQLQTKWAAVLNQVISAVSSLNTQAPTEQNLKRSGIYTTPNNVFYINIRMSATSGATTFGSSYLSATSSGPTIPTNLNNSAFFFTTNNYLDVIISNPNASYPYSVASSGYLVVREFYQ